MGASSVRRRQILKKLVLLGVTLTLVVAGLEIAARSFTSLSPPMYRSDPVLGKIYIPHAERTVYVPECDCRVHLRFNRDGLRGPDRPYEKPPGVRRVAVLGDSMVVAVATRETKTMTHVLEELLNASGRGVWEVINAGISGSSTGQELVLYREVVSRYRPDIVICAFFTGNDFGDNSRRLTSSRNRLYFDTDESGRLVRLPRPAAPSLVSGWLNRHSRLYVWHKIAVSHLRSRIRQRAGVLHEGSLVYWTEPEGDAAHAWRLLEELIEAMHDEVEADGARFALAALPAAVQLFDDSWQELLDKAGDRREAMDRHHAERRLREICGERGIPLATMLDEFRAATPHHSRAHEPEWLHHDGQAHFNDRGHRLVAEILHRLVSELDPAAGRPSAP